MLWGGGDVDHIHLLVFKHIFQAGIHLFNAIGLGKGFRLFPGAVGYGIEFPSLLFHSLGQLVGNDAAAQSRPAVFFLHEVTSKIFLLHRMDSFDFC